MPMSFDAQGGGTLADGSRTAEYCSHCYQNGGFTQPDLTMQDMLARVGGKLDEMNVPAPVKAAALADIPKLSRWASS
jgi:hypothetical protein